MVLERTMFHDRNLAATWLDQAQRNNLLTDCSSAGTQGWEGQRRQEEEEEEEGRKGAEGRMNVKRGIGEEVGGERRREERRSHLILEMCNLQRIERTERKNDKKEDIRQGVQKVAGIEGKARGTSTDIYITESRAGTGQLLRGSGRRVTAARNAREALTSG